MRKLISGFFLLIAVSAGLAFVGSLAKALFDVAAAVWGSGSEEPDKWKAVGAFGILLVLSGTLASIFSSESIASYHRKHVSLRWGTALLVVLLLHRSYYSFSYFLAGGELAWAAREGDKEFVQEILAEGDYDQEKLYDGWQGAVGSGRVEVAEILAPHILSEYDPCRAFYYGAAHNGRHPDQAAFVKVLIKAGGDPKECENLHYSVFTYARPDPTAVMRYLLEQGVEPGEKLREELSRPDPSGYWDHVREVYGMPAPPKHQPEE